MQYTLYVDESGDSGIRKIRTTETPGASPYMTIGAVLVPKSHESDLIERAESFASKIRRNKLHCAEMSHTQIVALCEQFRGGRFQSFGVISRKETLGKYRQYIDYSNQFYYHKCMQYVFEIVGRACLQHRIEQEDIDVVVEDGVCDLQALRSYIDQCRLRPLHPKARYLKRIDPRRIFVAQKAAVPLLQYADLIAHALFKAVDKSQGNMGVVEPRYLSELRKKFYSNPKDGKIVDWGIKAIHTLGQLRLDKTQTAFF